jgi:DNA-binding beta-propeller fold protein YncE
MSRCVRLAFLSLILAHIGAPQARAGALNQGRRVQAGGAGLLILTDPVLDRVVIFDLNRERPEKVGAFGSPGLGPGQLESPHGAALNSFRELFVADTMNHRVQVFDLGPLALGRSPRLVRLFGEHGKEPGQLDTPAHGVAIPNRGEADHLVYVADTGNDRVQVFDRHGRPTGLMIGARGSGEGQLDHPAALAFDPSGAVLYVVDGGHRRVCAFDAKTGRFLSRFGQPGYGDGELIAPEGLAVDSAGRIFVADPGGRRVLRFKPESDAKGGSGSVRFEGAWAYVGDKPGSWTHPQSLAIDGKDRVYVSDLADGRCQVFSPEGGFLAPCAQDVELPAPSLGEVTGGPSLPRSLCSNGGRYQLELRSVPSPVPANQMFGLELQVLEGCTNPKPAADVSLAIEAVMPEHRHGMTTQPVVEPLGNGRFRASGLLMHMAGLWELHVDVTRKGVLERAQADLVLE